jgi:hypothetical protein
MVIRIGYSVFIGYPEFLTSVNIIHLRPRPDFGGNSGGGGKTFRGGAAV